MHSRSTPDDDDPLAAALRPPPDESPDMRALRLAREEDARRGAHAVVVEVEEAQGRVRGEEVDEGRDGVQAEGVVAEVDGLQVR